MDIIEQARAIVLAHYEAKGWTTRAALFRGGKIQCADDVDLVVMAIGVERGRCEKILRRCYVEDGEIRAPLVFE